MCLSRLHKHCPIKSNIILILHNLSLNIAFNSEFVIFFPLYLVPFKYLTWCTLCKVVEISSKASQETNMRPPDYLAKEKNLSTVCDVVEISSKALKETNVRDPVSLAKEKNMSTVCDVEISSKTLKETNMRPPESLDEEKYLSTVCDVVEILFKHWRRQI